LGTGDVKTEAKVEYFAPKTPSTNPGFIFDQTALRTRDKGHLPLRNVPVFLDK
jgi:hypothetical protein